MQSIRLIPRMIGAVIKDPKSAKDQALRVIVQDIMDGRTEVILLITILHAITSFLGFAAFGEADLVTSWVTFAYYYVTTGSTIGYGDLSPTSTGGQLLFILWVAPGSLLIFGYILTKLLASMAFIVRNYMNGYGNFENTTGHLVIIGYVSGQTESLLAETSSTRKDAETVIVTIRDSLPLSDRIARVRTTSLASGEDLRRAGVLGASSVVIMAENDDETMSACLAISAIRPEGHVVAYFRTAEKASLVRPHCPGFEFVVSTSVQQVGRAMCDPGASQVFAHLASTSVGATLGSLDYTGADTTVGALSARLLSHGASLIGYRHDDAHEPIMDLSADTRIGEEHTVFYISAKRLPQDLFATVA